MQPGEAPIENFVVDYVNEKPSDPESAELAELRDSILKVGVVHPLTVFDVVDAEGKRLDVFLIVDGEKRFQIAKSIGLKSLPFKLCEAPKPH